MFVPSAILSLYGGQVFLGKLMDRRSDGPQLPGDGQLVRSGQVIPNLLRRLSWERSQDQVRLPRSWLSGSDDLRRWNNRVIFQRA